VNEPNENKLFKCQERDQKRTSDILCCVRIVIVVFGAGIYGTRNHIKS